MLQNKYFLTLYILQTFYVKDKILQPQNNSSER